MIEMMLDWMKRRGPRVSARPAAVARPALEDRGNFGEYQLLFKYLRDRYANRVVLTFAEIEDLVGFPLPDGARAQAAWWDGPDPGGRRSAQSSAWTLAGRTAVVNMPARNVVFDRDTTVKT